MGKERKRPEPCFLRSDGAIDYKRGIQYAKGRPRGYQPRKGGPPLLFATDVRMTILVTLALAKGPMRAKDLWRHIGRKYVGCATKLSTDGLICKWAAGKNEVYLGLNPAHPAAKPLKCLLLQIGDVYNFEAPTESLSRDLPSAPWNDKNARYTFGDHIRTFVLLLVHIIGEAPIFQVARCLPNVDRQAVSQVLWMYTAFGILRRKGDHYPTFMLNPEHVLTANISEILAILDRVMPHWRMVAEIQGLSRSRPRREVQSGRNPKRLKW